MCRLTLLQAVCQCHLLCDHCRKFHWIWGDYMEFFAHEHLEEAESACVTMLYLPTRVDIIDIDFRRRVQEPYEKGSHTKFHAFWLLRLPREKHT